MAIVAFKIVPRSSRTGPLGRLADGVFKWGVKAAPVDGRANAELIAALARFFGIPKQNITIRSGELSQRKVVELKSLEEDKIEEILEQSLDCKKNSA